MRQKWLFWIATAPALLLVCAPRTARAQECTGLETASQARWTDSAVRQLDTMAAKSRGERRRDIDVLEDERSATDIEDPQRAYLEGMRIGLTTTVDTRHHMGMTACRGDGRAGARLGATWWGTYYETEDMDVRPDFENHELPYKGGRAFYIRSRHRLHSDSDSLAWSSAMVGVGWDFAAQAGITVAGLHEESPDSDAWQTWQPGDGADTAHVDGWGFYTALALPFVGTRVSVASQPKFSGLALASSRPTRSLSGRYAVGSRSG